MRAMLGALSLLAVLAIVAVLATKQLGSGVAPAAGGAPATTQTVPTGTPGQQVEQFQKAVEGAMQQPQRDESK